MSCNTKKQQSTSLESYLIKPIQRILKYPLLLQQLKNAAVANSEEQQHLFDALIGMERVAEHINEMQRIHEEYGAIFDHLFRQHQKASKSVIFSNLTIWNRDVKNHCMKLSTTLLIFKTLNRISI